MTPSSSCHQRWTPELLRNLHPDPHDTGFGPTVRGGASRPSSLLDLEHEEGIGVGMVDETQGEAVIGLTPSVSTRLFRTVVILTPFGVLAWAAIGLGFYRLVA